MEQVGEGGRFRRGVFYFVVLLVFSHVVQAQMKYQTPRPDRPIRVFGGRFVFLTVQVNVILTCYAAVCLIESILGSRSKVLALVSSHFSSIAFPLGVFMGAGYYGFIHFHPKYEDTGKRVWAGGFGFVPFFATNQTHLRL